MATLYFEEGTETPTVRRAPLSLSARLLLPPAKRRLWNRSNGVSREPRLVEAERWGVSVTIEVGQAWQQFDKALASAKYFSC